MTKGWRGWRAPCEPALAQEGCNVMQQHSARRLPPLAHSHLSPLFVYDFSARFQVLRVWSYPSQHTLLCQVTLTSSRRTHKNLTCCTRFCWKASPPAPNQVHHTWEQKMVDCDIITLFSLSIHQLTTVHQIFVGFSYYSLDFSLSWKRHSARHGLIQSLQQSNLPLLDLGVIIIKSNQTGCVFRVVML